MIGFGFGIGLSAARPSASEPPPDPPPTGFILLTGANGQYLNGSDDEPLHGVDE